MNNSSKLPLKRDFVKRLLLNSAKIKHSDILNILKSLDVSLTRLMGMTISQ